MKQIFVSFCILILLAAVSGCSNSNVNSPATVNGTITGLVSLGSEFSGSSPHVLTSSAGVSVSLDGTSLSTLTDSSGFWKIDNVPDGNYDVTIMKSGFGLMRIYGVAVGGPGTAFIPRVNLGDLPPQAPELVSAKVVTVVWVDTGKQKSRDDMQIRWKTTYDRSYSGLAIFIDKDASVQPADVHYYTTLNSTINGTLLNEWQGWNQTNLADSLPHSNAHDGMISCPIETLHARGITSGMKIYVSLAQWDPYSINGQVPNTNVTYYDPIHNQNRVISPSPVSNVVALTMQ